MHCRPYPFPQLKRHAVVHSREKPHCCPLCPNRFSQRASMFVHLDSAHGRQADTAAIKHEISCGRTPSMQMLGLE